jgi:membrane protein DedA with SNARE-associated domain
MSFASSLPETQLALTISILVATLVYEDGATVLAATLSASGRLEPALGLVAAFVGIWVGDIGLYALGSSVGRYTAKSRWLQSFLRPEPLAKAQAWFTRHGSMALVLSRAIPGSRLPLYLAAGALRLPLRQFVQITGICAALWVSAIFAVWRFTPIGSGKLLPWILTASMLLVPWLVGKSLGPFIRKAQIGKRASDQGIPGVCAL